MPLHDHFRPPWSVQRPWEGFLSAWATAIAFHLNNSGILPPEYFGFPLLQAAGKVEVDFEVQVLCQGGRPQLRAAIELASPANKDRPGTRRAFAAKCAEYLRRGVSVIVIDIVTEPQAVLLADVLRALEVPGKRGPESPTSLYAVSYRSTLGEERPCLEVWPRALALGAPLPELPMWLEIDLCVPLRLEESYTVTCASLRMRG